MDRTVIPVFVLIHVDQSSAQQLNFNRSTSRDLFKTHIAALFLQKDPAGGGNGDLVLEHKPGFEDNRFDTGTNITTGIQSNDATLNKTFIKCPA